MTPGVVTSGIFTSKRYIEGPLEEQLQCSFFLRRCPDVNVFGMIMHVPTQPGFRHSLCRKTTPMACSESRTPQTYVKRFEQHTHN